MRTGPDDNFGAIEVHGELVHVEVWKQNGLLLSKSRVEKPGRVIVVNGISAVAYFRSENMALVLPLARHGALDTYPLVRLTDIKELMTEELRGAQFKGWPIHAADETTAAGEKKIVITVEAKSGLPDGDITKNTFYDNCDMRRVYRFDAKTSRLESAQWYIPQPGGELLVLTTERIEYDQPIDQAVFNLKLPDNVQYWKEPQPLSDNEKYEKLTPAEAAQAFFEACVKEDWDEAQKFWFMAVMAKKDRERLGGLQIVKLGEPFQSKGWHGWYIPYEIKLKDGTVKKGDLAMRNDTPANRYIVDGGMP